MRSLFLSLIMLFIFTSCMAPVQESKKYAYFDLEVFVDSLLLDSKLTNVKKTVRLNDKTETKELPEYDLRKELELLRKYNINKSSLAGKYKETVEGDSITYQALEEDLRAQALTIIKKSGLITELRIEGIQESILADSPQTIIFRPGNSFLLRAENFNKYDNNLMKEVLIEY